MTPWAYLQLIVFKYHRDTHTSISFSLEDANSFLRCENTPYEKRYVYVLRDQLLLGKTDDTTE